MLSIITLFIAMFYFNVNLTKPNNVMICIYCVEAGFIVFFIVYLVLLFRNKTAKEKAAIQRAEMSESKLALYQYTKETYEEVKSIRHDIKGHYNYLSELSHQNKEVYSNLSFLSTGKDDKVNHGYGTKIVKSIVQRYHGIVTYWKDDMNFYVRVIVPST